MNMESLLETYPIEQIEAIVLHGGMSIVLADAKSVEVENTIGALVVVKEDISGHVGGAIIAKPDITMLYPLNKIIAVKVRVTEE